MNAYLVLVTWPNGMEGLLFPRPGNVAVAATTEAGNKDFETAKQHLLEYKAASHSKLDGTTIRLIHFERKETLAEFKL